MWLASLLTMVVITCATLIPCQASPLANHQISAHTRIPCVVFYATNRAPFGNSYSNKRHYGGTDHGIIYGEVSLPSNTTKPCNLSAIKPVKIKRDDFYRDLHAQEERSGNKEIAVFVHGYNSSIKDAIDCGIKLSHALACPVVVFDWCSLHKLFGYTIDECNIEWSLKHFQLLMQGLEKEFDAENITMVSHSMGNRVVYWYLQSRYDKNQQKPELFREIVLTSPDVDRGTFKNYFFKVAGNAKRVRIYVSAHDKPLRLSKFVHSYSRLGDGRDEDGQTIRWEFPGTIPGTETINFTLLDKRTWLGHSIQFDLIANMHKTDSPGSGLDLKKDDNFKAEYERVVKATSPDITGP